jgi:hypothetical protein
VSSAIAPVASTSAAASAAPAEPPPRVPGRIVCGANECHAGTEVCCLGSPPRCVPARGADPHATWEACGKKDFLRCDDAGDCGEGKTCCEETFYEADGVQVFHGACLPTKAGKVSCARAELCSQDDAACLRKDNVCGDKSDDDPRRRCSAPAQARKKPLCGSKPCDDGMTCVEPQEGKRACVPGVLPRYPENIGKGVIECDRGRDCGEDESCFTNPQVAGHRCDWGLAGVDPLSESALCADVTDCAAFCRNDPARAPSCHVDPSTRQGRCECLMRCAKEQDCKSNDCTQILLARGAADTSGKAFCDKARGVCECGAPGKKR